MSTKDDGKYKPVIIKVYDLTKIGTDIVNQRNANITTKTKSSCWTKLAFSYVLDVARNNALVVYAMANKKNVADVDSFKFTLELARVRATTSLKTQIGWITSTNLAKDGKSRSIN